MAAIGMAQFERYAGMLSRRQEIIRRYNEALATYRTQTLNHLNGGDHISSGHLYLVRLLDKSIEHKE